MEPNAEGCLSCASLAGERPISPGPAIFEGTHWVVEHAYPTALRGWLVLVLRRHAAALHALAGDEWAELGSLQRRAVELLRAELACEKEYTACFAEAPGFHHVHMHVVAKPAGLSEAYRGARIFGLLGPGDTARDAAGFPIVPVEEMRVLCERLRAAW